MSLKNSPLYLAMVFAFVFTVFAACNNPQKQAETPPEQPEQPEEPAYKQLPQGCSEPCQYTDTLVEVVTATQWMSTYRNQFPDAPLAFFFSTDDIVQLLTTQSADGYRMYFGMYEQEGDEDLDYVDRMRLLMVPVIDTNDIEVDSILGFEPSHTFQLGQENLLHGNVTSQQFNSMAGAGWMAWEKASAMTADWRMHQHEAGHSLLAYTFCIDWLCALLTQGNGTPPLGLRFYIGYDSSTQQMRLVNVAVDALGNDIVRDGNNNSKVVDWSAPCPQMCGKPSDLNN